MNTIKNFLRTGPGDYLKTIFICTLVAVLINIVENNTDYAWLTFFCSFCYGLCTHVSVNLAQKWFPYGTKVIRYLLPSIFGFILATLIISIVSGRFLTGISSDIMGWLFIALVAHSLTMYWLFVLERNAQMTAKLKVAELEKVEKEKALIQSQLCLLQAQIEPHFLFNTIANLKAAIQLDPKRAMATLDHLTILLRQTLKRSKDQQLTLGDELEFCNSYLAVQQMRLGERMEVKVELDERVNLQQLFPPLLIQPLVENAVLHGIESHSEPCILIIRVVLESKNYLRIEVQDNGVGLGGSTHQGHGIGLDNMRQRLRHYYVGRARMEIAENQLGGVTAMLGLPLDDALTLASATY